MYKYIKATVVFHCEKCNEEVTKPFFKVVTCTANEGTYTDYNGTVSVDVTCPMCYTSYGIEE